MMEKNPPLAGDMVLHLRHALGFRKLLQRREQIISALLLPIGHSSVVVPFGKNK